jgi:hypothetical protein
LASPDTWALLFFFLAIGIIILFVRMVVKSIRGEGCGCHATCAHLCHSGSDNCNRRVYEEDKK